MDHLSRAGSSDGRRRGTYAAAGGWGRESAGAAGDVALAAIAGLFIYARIRLYALAAHVPGLRAVADRRLIAKLRAQLASYGHAEFTTDAAHYRPSAAPVPAE